MNCWLMDNFVAWGWLGSSPSLSLTITHMKTWLLVVISFAMPDHIILRCCLELSKRVPLCSVRLRVLASEICRLLSCLYTVGKYISLCNSFAGFMLSPVMQLVITGGVTLNRSLQKYPGNFLCSWENNVSKLVCGNEHNRKKGSWEWELSCLEILTS